MANTNLKLGRLAKLGLLAALSIVLVFFIHFPIFPTAKFLEYDPADIPIMIATFAFGPWYGLMTTIVVAVVQGLTVSASGGIYGILQGEIIFAIYLRHSRFLNRHDNVIISVLHTDVAVGTEVIRRVFGFAVAGIVVCEGAAIDPEDCVSFINSV